MKPGRQIRYEACVAGAVPVVKVMRESMTGAGLHTVYGIVNGTTNYILTAMQRGEGDYATTLAAAQRMGYAEADPTDDVSGADAAAKMAIWRPSPSTRASLWPTSHTRA